MSNDASGPEEPTLNADRLSSRTLQLLPPHVGRPDYDRSKVLPGIVHLGVGAFHKAHQAMYTDHCLRSRDLGWGIVGASLQSPAMRNALRQQDYLYTVDARSDDERDLRVVAAISHVLHAPTEGEALLAAMSDRRVRIVSLTVTEKGYTTNVATGSLNQGDANVQHDLVTSGPPRTALGYLTEALRRRRRAGIEPFTVLSCDNLPQNGRILRQSLLEFASLRDASLGRYVSDEVACPCTMVDRIVPAVTDSEREALEQTLGVRDDAPVITELFTQWVIEDRFLSGRPEWECAGAEIVGDVHPHERMKLRLLNGAHTVLATAGIVLGLRTVAEAFSDPTLNLFLQEFWRESSETLPAGLDPQAYSRQLAARFLNRSLQHRLDQIARDSSLKVPQRILLPLLERRHRDESSPAMLLALSVWIRFTLGIAETGVSTPIDDPAAKTWSSSMGLFDPTPDAVRNLVQDRLASLGNPEAMSGSLCDELSLIVRELMCRGVRAVLSFAASEQPGRTARGIGGA